MKRVLLLLSIILLAYGCKKSSNNKSTSYTYQQLWDSVGIQYEHKYLVMDMSLPMYGDTIVFHSNNTITESAYAIVDSGIPPIQYLTYPVKSYGIDTFNQSSGADRITAFMYFTILNNADSGSMFMGEFFHLMSYNNNTVTLYKPYAYMVGSHWEWYILVNNILTSVWIESI